VLIGTLYPLALEQLTGEKITVGAPFFNMTCGVLLLILCLVVPFGQSLAWKRGDLLGVAQRLSLAAAVGLCLAVALFAMLRGGPVLAPIAAGLAVYIILGSLSEIAARVWRRGAPVGVLLSRALGLPLSAWGSALAHIGVGVTLLGLAATAFGAETIASMHVGEAQSVGPYQVVLSSIAARPGPNYSEVVATADIRWGGAVVATVEPAKRFFAARQMSTTQAGIATLWFGQLYISIGDQTGNGIIAARLYWKPLVTFIWLGACLMALGGALSLADRRLRIGAPAPARTASPPVAAAR
jgi:cytochrome c-type biogenesis protein CcmF